MTRFTTDFQHSGMPAKDLDETIKFYTETLGFELAGLFHNGENRCAFLRYGHLTIETWEGDPGTDDHRRHQPLGVRHPRTSRRRSRTRRSWA
jgi:catechol 2,3-dioxygenase-like lactoylglutathione lyase family enzyme